MSRMEDTSGERGIEQSIQCLFINEYRYLFVQVRVRRRQLKQLLLLGRRQVSQAQEILRIKHQYLLWASLQKEAVLRKQLFL